MLWPSFKTNPSLEEGTIPVSPRPLRRWLKALPLLDVGETTRLLYDGLVSLNQTVLPPGQRIQNMELIRESTQPVLEHLSRQFIARSLPLPPRGRKILRLLLRLHKEIATGYKLALDDTFREGLLSSKLLALATHRAMRHMDLIHLLTSQLYETEPSGMWLDIHWLYAFAEAHGITASLVKDPTLTHIRQSRIVDVYLQSLLLALAVPSTLRQGEAERLSHFFESHAGLASIEKDLIGDTNNGVYLINLKLDQPPTYIAMSEIQHLPNLRSINIGNLLAYLREQLQRSDAIPDKALPRGRLPTEFIRRLMLTLTRHIKRDFSRSDRIEHIYVAIGLDAIYSAMQADTERAGYNGASFDALYAGESSRGLHLQTIADQHPLRHNDDPENYYDPNASNEDIWRLVVDDKLWDPGTSTTSDEFKMDGATSKSLDLSPPQVWAEWKLENTSPGGYCISWEQHDPAQARVGELIALRTREEGHRSNWEIGIIRWIRNVPDDALFTGIQLIASKSYLITVHSAQTLEHTHAAAMDGLLLPEVKSLRQPSSLILPANHFHTGDLVAITEGANESQVLLRDRILYASGFSQFMISADDTALAHAQDNQYTSFWPEL